MRLKFPYLATIAVMLLVSQAAIAGELFPKVVVTVAPLKPYVDEILRGSGEAKNLLRPGQEPHDFALSPSQAKLLEEADVVIIPDLGMNPFLKRLLANKKARVIELSSLEGAEPLPYAAENPFLKGMKLAPKPDIHAHDAHAARIDPHLWLDPERMAAIAVPLAEAIAQKTPETRPVLVANAKALAQHLREEVLPPLKAMLGKQPRMVDGIGEPQLPFITYHAAYQYFLARFGLAHFGEITTRPEEMIGAKTAVSLIGAAETLRVRCLIGEQETTLMQRVAAATDARMVLLSPEQLVDRTKVDALDWIRNDYDRFMYVTAKAFAGCL